MKAVNIQRLSLILALMLGIMAFWSAATPANVNGSSINGGWTYYEGEACCETTGTSNCDRGYHNSVWMRCEPDDLIILWNSFPYTGRPYPPAACKGSDLCENVCNSCCDCD